MAGGTSAIQAYNTYKNTVRKEVDAILKSQKGPDGKPLDLTDPVARHQFLSDDRNANLSRKLISLGMKDAFSEFLGNKAGALTGKIADVAAPGMNPFGRAGLSEGAASLSEQATKKLFEE